MDVTFNQYLKNRNNSNSLSFLAGNFIHAGWYFSLSYSKRAIFFLCLMIGSNTCSANTKGEQEEKKNLFVSCKFLLPMSKSNKSLWTGFVAAWEGNKPWTEFPVCFPSSQVGDVLLARGCLEQRLSARWEGVLTVSSSPSCKRLGVCCRLWPNPQGRSSLDFWLNAIFHKLLWETVQDLSCLAGF